MSKKVHLNKGLTLPGFGLVGLAVFLAWQGSGPDGESDDTQPDSSSSRHRPASGMASSADHDSSADRPHQTEADPSEGAEHLAAAPVESVDGEIIARGSDRPNLRQGTSRSVPDSSKRSGARSGKLRSALSRSAGAGARSRVAAIETARRSNLTDDERREGLDFLASDAAPQGLSAGQNHWLIDELITTLRVDGADNAELSRRLADISTDPARDPVVRDYALQHLGHLRREGGDTAIIDAALWDATEERQGTLAGTAFLALHQAGGAEEGQGPEIARSALQAASDEATDLRSRITALQVAGKQGHHEALAFAVETAADSSQPVVLRMSAIATLGDLGSGEQIAMLSELKSAVDPRLATAAAAAIETLTAR